MKPTTTIMIGEKEYTLRYSIKALSLLEDLLDSSINSIDFEDLKINDLIKVLYAGIVDKKNLSLDKLTDEIDENLDLQEAMELIGKAMSSAFGVGEVEKK